MWDTGEMVVTVDCTNWHRYMDSLFLFSADSLCSHNWGYGIFLPWSTWTVVLCVCNSRQPTQVLLLPLVAVLKEHFCCNITEWFYFWQTIWELSRAGLAHLRAPAWAVSEESSSAGVSNEVCPCWGSRPRVGPSVLCEAVCAFCPARGFGCHWSGGCLSTPEPSAPSLQHQSSSSSIPDSTCSSVPLATEGRCPAPDGDWQLL